MVDEIYYVEVLDFDWFGCDIGYCVVYVVVVILYYEVFVFDGGVVYWGVDWLNGVLVVELDYDFFLVDFGCFGCGI